MSCDSEKFIGQPVALGADIFGDTIPDMINEDHQEKLGIKYQEIAKKFFANSKTEMGVSLDEDVWHKIIFREYIDGTIDKEMQSRWLIKLILEAIYREDGEKIRLLVGVAAEFLGYKDNTDELKLHIAYFLVDNEKFTSEMIGYFVSFINSGDANDNILISIINRVGESKKNFAVEFVKGIRDPKLRESILKILVKK